MKYKQLHIFLFLIFGFFISCRNESVDKERPLFEKEVVLVKDSILEEILEEAVSTDPAAFCIDTLVPAQSYAQTKTEIATQRLLLAQAYQNSKISLDSVGRYFEQALLNQIIPYWYGTAWTFEGHTNIPNQGTIACGYFVSTTLKHMGVNLNRYKLAQQWPKHEAKSLDTAMILVEGNCEELLQEMQEGIYFIGLDASHVGYLLKRQNHLFFIHSNYSSPTEVVIEDAAFSEVFMSYRSFYLAKLSANNSLMEAWLSKERLSVVTEGG